MASHQRTSFLALAVFLLSATLASCASFDVEESDLPDITFKRPSSWNEIAEPDKYTYYSEDNELKCVISQSDKLDSFINDALSKPDEYVLVDYNITGNHEILISADTEAKDITISGVSNNIKMEFRIVGFSVKKRGYVFVFSQKQAIGPENLKTIERVIKSIHLKETAS